MEEKNREVNVNKFWICNMIDEHRRRPHNKEDGRKIAIKSTKLHTLVQWPKL